MFGLPKKVFHLDTNMNMAIKQIPHVILPSGIIIPQKHSSDGTLETNSKLTGSDVGEEFTFQDAVIVTGEGEHLTLSGQDKVIVSIPTGTSTSRNIVFKATSLGVTAYMLGAKVESSGSITLAVSTTNQNEVWEVTGLSGYDDFFCEVTAVAGGNVTVKGRLVA